MWTQNKELMQFLYESAQAGYASGNKDIRVSGPDGSTSIIIEQGPWRYVGQMCGGLSLFGGGSGRVDD